MYTNWKREIIQFSLESFFLLASFFFFLSVTNDKHLPNHTMFSKYIIHVTFVLENVGFTFQQEIKALKVFINRVRSTSALCHVNFHQKIVEELSLFLRLILKMIAAFSAAALLFHNTLQFSFQGKSILIFIFSRWLSDKRIGNLTKEHSKFVATL